MSVLKGSKRSFNELSFTSPTSCSADIHRQQRFDFNGTRESHHNCTSVKRYRLDTTSVVDDVIVPNYATTQSQPATAYTLKQQQHQEQQRQHSLSNQLQLSSAPTSTTTHSSTLASQRNCVILSTPLTQHSPLFDRPSHFTSEPLDVSLLDLQSLRQEISRSRRSPPNPTPTVYTESQVRRIIADVVAKRESLLRKEYDARLNQLLAEQFDNFSQFNKDYISRQMRQSECSYLS